MKKFCLNVVQKRALCLQCDQLRKNLFWEGLVKNVCNMKILNSSSHFVILLTEVTVNFAWVGHAIVKQTPD